MDVNQDFEDFSGKIKKALLDYGGKAAMQLLDSTTFRPYDANDDLGALRAEAYMQGMNACLDAQSQVELGRIIEAFNNLQRLGVRTGVSAAVQMGLPLRELFVSYTPSLGRLGDFLYQIRRLIAAKYVRNLIVSFPLPEEIASGPCFVVGGDQFLSTRKPIIYELGFIDLSEFIALDAESVALASSCPWILRYLPSSFFGGFMCENPPFRAAYTALHLRGGDALHEADVVYYQPPLSYYLDAINSSKCERLALVSEPDDMNKSRFNPLRKKIADFCINKGVEVVEVSNSDLRFDISALFRASQVISGSSSLGRELSLASLACETIFSASSELRTEVNLAVIDKYSLGGRAPSIKVFDRFSYPSADEWKNLELRYSWLLNN